MARPMMYAEAEALASNLVALGYQARAYPAKPTGHKVIVTGQRGGERFRYEVSDPDTGLDTILAHLTSGLTGEDKALTEGV